MQGKDFSAAFKVAQALSRSLQPVPSLGKLMLRLAKIGTVSLRDVAAGATITIHLDRDRESFKQSYMQWSVTEVCQRVHLKSTLCPSMFLTYASDKISQKSYVAVR